MSDKQAVVNIDYVATVVDNGGRLELCLYNTNAPRGNIGQLCDMKDDDKSSLIHMQNVVASMLPERVPPFINYLAPISCSNAYVSGIQYPEPMSESEYEKAQVDAEESAERALKDRLLSLYPDDENKREQEFSECIAEERCRARIKEVKRLKLDYYYSARRYIYAWHYLNTIKVNRIKSRLNEDVKMYSTDTIGFTHFKYPISTDVEIKLHTNFGYGAASFFRLELTYKGVAILPYSFYVNYYYANSRDLARYTRLYHPARENWGAAFKFVVETANLAAEDPKRFVREWVMDEVGTMVEKLKLIMKDPAEYMSTWLSKMNEANTESPYLHVRHVDQAVASEYKCYPYEMAIDFKAKKISGALEFIDSLRALKSIYNEVDRPIEVIKELGRAIVPEIRLALVRIRYDINKLNSTLHEWQERRKKAEVKIIAYEAACQLLVDAKMSKINRNLLGKYDQARIEAEIRSGFEHDNPAFLKEMQIRDSCLKEETRIEDDIRKRTRFGASLESCEEKILAARL